MAKEQPKQTNIIDTSKNVSSNIHDMTPKCFSYMTFREMADKYSNQISKFVVFENTEFTTQDWISLDVFTLLIDELRTHGVVNYQLKSRSLPNGNRGGIDGKATKITLGEIAVDISIHVQSFQDKSDKWHHTRTYRINRGEFDFYTSVILNDLKIQKLRNIYAAKAKSSIDLS